MKPALVVAVAAGLLAVPLPDLLNALQRGRQKRTMGDLRTIATAIESYHIDETHYPQVESIWDLAELVEPTYIKKVPTLDGWGEPFDYWLLAPEVYYLRSGGADRTLEYFDPRDHMRRRKASRSP